MLFWTHYGVRLITVLKTQKIRNTQDSTLLKSHHYRYNQVWFLPPVHRLLLGQQQMPEPPRLRHHARKPLFFEGCRTRHKLPPGHSICRTCRGRSGGMAAREQESPSIVRHFHIAWG